MMATTQQGTRAQRGAAIAERIAMRHQPSIGFASVAAHARLAKRAASEGDKEKTITHLRKAWAKNRETRPEGIAQARAARARNQEASEVAAITAATVETNERDGWTEALFECGDCGREYGTVTQMDEDEGKAPTTCPVCDADNDSEEIVWLGEGLAPADARTFGIQYSWSESTASAIRHGRKV